LHHRPSDTLVETAYDTETLTSESVPPPLPSTVSDDDAADVAAVVDAVSGSACARITNVPSNRLWKSSSVTTFSVEDSEAYTVSSKSNPKSSSVDAVVVVNVGDVVTLVVGVAVVVIGAAVAAAAAVAGGADVATGAAVAGWNTGATGVVASGANTGPAVDATAGLYTGAACSEAGAAVAGNSLAGNTTNTPSRST